jgi:hypothetical protein
MQKRYRPVSILEFDTGRSAQALSHPSREWYASQIGSLLERLFLFTLQPQLHEFGLHRPNSPSSPTVEPWSVMHLS